MRLAPSARTVIRATTLVETVVAAALIAGFFGTIYEVNAVCFRYIDASKEVVGALEGVHDRIEQLRGLTFANLTSATNVKSTMSTPANSSDFARGVQEVVTITDYFNSAKSTVFTRPAGASSTVTAVPSSGADFSTSTLVKVNVTYTWTTTFGGRSMSEQSETIVSAGNKKA
jgi:hypothetical protein